MGSVAPLQADASLVNPEAEAPEAPEAPGGAARYEAERVKDMFHNLYR